MFINPAITEELYDEDERRYERAKQYVVENKVDIIRFHYEDANNFSLSSLVTGNETYQVHIEAEDGEIIDVRCECPDYEAHYGACKHIMATMLEVEKNPKYTAETRVGKTNQRYIEFKDLLNTFYEDEFAQMQDPKEDKKVLNTQIKIIPKLAYDKYQEELTIEFKIGTSKQFYKLKDILLFYQNMITKQTYKYGEKLEFIHDRENFDEHSLPIVDFILKYAEMIKYIKGNTYSSYHSLVGGINQNHIVLSHTALDEIFEILKNQEISLQRDYETQEIKLIDRNPDITFSLEKIDEQEYKLICNLEEYRNYQIFEGNENSYYLTQHELYRCSKEYANSILKLLEVFKRNYTKEIKFNKEQLSNFFSIILPKVEKSIILDAIDIEQIEQFMPQKLGVKVFLDFDNRNYMIAKILFCYGENEFNPLEKEPIFPRNIIEEVNTLNQFRRTGFLLDRKNAGFVLVEEEKIYQFLTQEIQVYMKQFEVLVSQNFKEKQIQQPKIASLGVRVENNLLTLDVGQFNFDKAELKDILKKYQLKKKYHRLKDGSFLTLEGNEEIQFLDNLITGGEITYQDIAEGAIQLPMYRGIYLEQILEKLQHVEIQRDRNYTEMVKELQENESIDKIVIPEGIQADLRKYQKEGYKWLKGLDQYHLGGILADDMGLGKTLQLILIILDYKQKQEIGRKPVLVVCPSSLSLNWKNEIEKFAPSLSNIVISGNASQRRQQIHRISQYDVIITSYDLLKRDIDIYTEVNESFRYMIADEAQYIKNSNTQNAKAIKQIKAETRYALTGTPIENSLSELWSIFDFLMPGYLFSYKKFKEYYELPILRENDTQAMQKLKMLIAPFILRRTKKEVLTELPDKTITVLNNEMEEEQQKIYVSYLSQAKNELKEELDNKGFEKSQIKILALLTRLRQICCHPSLFIDNYQGESSKLTQCIEIMKDGIESGHKILLFSTYTSMFDMIEKELKKEKIRYCKLTGQTKVNERIHLVDKFNEDSQIKVFLISLKAGGTGLNLTGADMVIHYDPWWNLSAENQATDRAYRIGQKNNVQVYKLITKNSIEEKIYELQEKKAKLIDNVLDTNTSFINTLSKEDIMKLFE